MLAYYPPGQTDPITAKIDPCKVEVVDGTGAGDTFKAGLTTYIVENLDAFRQGRFNVHEAGQFSNATAASYISEKGTLNVRDYAGTMESTRQQYAQRLPPDVGPTTPTNIVPPSGQG